jgi:hypothetical protein
MTGVDAAYFHQVIELLKKHQAETGADKIDEAYLMKVIDAIF